MSASAARYSAASARPLAAEPLRGSRRCARSRSRNCSGSRLVERGARCRRASRRPPSRSARAATTWRPSRRARASGYSLGERRATGRSCRTGASAGGDQLARAGPGSRRRSWPLLRRLLAAYRRERVGVGLELRVGELLAEGVDLGELRAAARACSRSGPASTSSSARWRSSAVEYCIETRCLIWWLRLSRTIRPPLRVRRVQQRRDEAVALVEVGLPVEGVVLVGPRHVPDGGAREGHRREAGLLGAQAELASRPT